MSAIMGPSFGAKHNVIVEPVLASEREERLQVENVVAPPCQQGGLPTSKEAVVCLPASKEGFLRASKRGGVVLPASERG